MLIDWFTVVAQVINFLILVWLLRHFLYKPILDAIDTREKGIAAKLAEAEAKKADAQKERDDFQHKNEAFDKERAGLLKKATDDANAERQQLLDQARKDADTLRAKRQDALQSEQLHLSQEVVRWTQNEVFAITRKTLSDLANASLEERMCDAFVGRLRALNETAKDQLIAAFKNSPQPAQVRSAFQLPQTQRGVVESAVKETFAAETPVQFETVPELVSGIELSVNGQKVAWSIADYLTTLEKSASKLLHGDGELESKPGANSTPVNGAHSKTEPKPAAKVAAKAEPNHEPVPTPSSPKADH
jgi:F-type H+-transporting ATPase subunit b